jgi:hypothetical protein
MLRSFEYSPASKQILEVLRRFNIVVPEHIALVRFEVISPDSFMWRLLIDEAVYYLYAEDYVPGLKHVKTVFNQYLDDDKWSFIEPKTFIEFEEATPVKGASTYKKADDADEMMQYAVESGHDFVFLVRSNDDPENAQFSESAPRGFIIGAY